MEWLKRDPIKSRVDTSWRGGGEGGGGQVWCPLCHSPRRSIEILRHSSMRIQGFWGGPASWQLIPRILAIDISGSLQIPSRCFASFRTINDAIMRWAIMKEHFYMLKYPLLRRPLWKDQLQVFQDSCGILHGYLGGVPKPIDACQAAAGFSSSSYCWYWFGEGRDPSGLLGLFVGPGCLALAYTEFFLPSFLLSFFLSFFLPFSLSLSFFSYSIWWVENFSCGATILRVSFVGRVFSTPLW